MCVLRLPADLGTVPDLCAHLRDLLLGTGAAVAVCDVSAFARVDLDTLEALARVQLAARELGREVWFRHASPQLRQLLALTGLSDTLPTL
ncbi:STAS domain-containing protein [Nitriliruptoraceae bacterium ZYF776]|nr:STAS domain-containing protein [Profundirhabdus halotolerans]